MDWIISRLNAVSAIIALLAIAALLWIFWLLLKGAAVVDAAGWAQAIAATVAIWAAYGVAAAQLRASERQQTQRQVDVMLAINAASQYALKRILDVTKKFETELLTESQFKSKFRRVPLETAARALEAIPVHEIGNARISERVIHLSGLLRQALEELDHTKEKLAVDYNTPRATPSLGAIAGDARGTCNGIADCLRVASQNQKLKLSKAEKAVLATVVESEIESG